MKKLNMIVAGLLLMAPWSMAVAGGFAPQQEDTIIVSFGKSQIIIALNSEADKKRLEKLDLNAIIIDLKEQIRNSDGEITSIKIEDSEGSIYIKSENREVESESSVAVIEMDNDAPFERKVRSKGSFVEVETKKVRKRSGTRQSTNFDIGLNNFLSNGQFVQDSPNDFGVSQVLRPINSRYVAINSILSTPVIGPVSLEWGGGISWYNFRFENSRTRIANVDGRTEFYNDDMLKIDPIRSKLGVTHLNVSLVPVMELGRKKVKIYENSVTGATKKVTHTGTRFSVGAGVYAGYRIDSWSNFVFRQNGDKSRLKDKNNYNLNNYRYGVRGQIGIAGLDLFVNYDLNELFVKGRGPEYNVFSFGVTF
jgi:hypothetical protein